MRRLTANKMLIAVLCVLIGTAPLVAFVNIIESGKHMLKRELIDGASFMLDISLENSSAVYDDFTALAEEMPEITAVIPISISSDVISSYRNSSPVTIKAVNNRFWKYAGLEMVKGKFITKGHMENHDKVVVIDDLTADHLFGTREVIGRNVDVPSDKGNIEATIIGVCKRSDVSDEAISKEKGFAYIPITMLESNDSLYKAQKTLLVVKNMKIAEAKAKISHFLKVQGVEVDSENINPRYQIESVEVITEKYKAVILPVSIIWLALTATALVNLMLLDIEQNKKLYGLLKFYGSTTVSIRNKLLIKAYSLALISCGFSLLTGITASFIVCQIFNISLYISIYSLTLGILLPIILYLTAAIYSAKSISELDVNNIIWELE